MDEPDWGYWFTQIQKVSLALIYLNVMISYTFQSVMYVEKHNSNEP